MNLDNQLKECDNLYEKQDFKELVKKCDEILEEFPDNQNAMGYKGISHLALDEDGKAMEVLKRGVELYPDNYYLKNNLAMVYYKLGEYETSLTLCEEGLKIKDFDWLCENKFKNLIRLGRYDEAIEFEKTIKHDLALHLVFLEEGMGEHELNYYSHLLKDNPDDFYIIDMIKSAASKLNVTPDVGDYYLKWIDCIGPFRCPECAGELDSFANGTDNYRCSACGDVFKLDFENLNLTCADESLANYAKWNVFFMTAILKEYPADDPAEISELKIRMVSLDGAEFAALTQKLLEIDYIRKPDDGHMMLS